MSEVVVSVRQQCETIVEPMIKTFVYDLTDTFGNE